MSLQVREVTRSFGERTALDKVSFQVAAGKLTGFVGGNGAGKTTTMRIILGVLAADSGTVEWQGQPLSAEVRHRFGYMPEERGLYPKMRVAEQLIYLARLHGLTPVAAQKSAAELIERLELGERRDDQIETLSLGNQQRAQIAAALVHGPEALILDEPFSGLDPMAIDNVLTVLTEYANRGAPVLFSSHQLDLVERLCDDLVIIAAGKIRAAGSKMELRAQYSEPRYRLHASNDLGWVRDFPGVEVTELAGNEVTFKATHSETANQLLRSCLERSEVISFVPDAPTLAEIFKGIVTNND